MVLRKIILILLLTGLFLVGWWLGRRSVDVRIIEHTRIDTAYFERPQPHKILSSAISVEVPKWLFAPADTTFTTVTINPNRDSVPVQLPFERREYRDSSYFAIVSGIALGDCHPTLEHIESMDGEPIMLIECKHWSADLSKYKAQLFRYYHVSQAKFGVLTNGINYQFYTDLDTPNKMDDKPFFEIDMLNLKDSHIEKLKQFRHDQYNTYMILNSATEMKYINALRSLIVKESSNPSDLFVKFMTKQVYDGVVTKNIIDEFRPMIQRAFQQYTNDYINERLKSAITPDVPSVEVSSNVSTEKSVANEEDMQDGNKIVTTDEELMGFYIVRAILCNTVDLDRVVDRDAQSYFAILFDDNNRKPICRLHFNGGKKYVETFDEEKKGTKHLITALTDIYKLSDQLISTVKFYLK